MKKYLIYPLFAASFTLASCNEDFNEKIASPQQWEQEAAIILSGFNATGTTNIDLGKVTTDSVNIISITAPNGMPKDTNLDNFRINLTQEAPGNTTVTIHADNNGNVATKDLQSAIETIYGKRPVLRTFNAEISANMMMNGQASLLSATTTITATPKAPFISEAYYLVGGMSGWSTAEAIKFSHSEKDVYEDPFFNLIFTAGDECWWKIISQSNMDAGSIDVEGVIGVKNGDTSLSGKLISENPGAGKIEEGGMYKMTLNMLDYTYTLSKLAPEYYILGDSPFDWNVNDKKHMLYPQSSTIHSYTTKFTGNQKIINSNDMGTNKWEACYGTPNDGDTSTSAALRQNAGAIHVPETGYYTLTLDFKNQSYTWTKCENQDPKTYQQISLVGAFNGWNPADTQYDMTEIAPHNWFIKGVVLTAGELKFNADDAWTDSWGNPEANIGDKNYGKTIYNAGNMNVPAGTYDVFFNDITGEFVFQSK